ncbi:hypothetical protein [Pseudomonas taiwanensis]|uniref:hypothetical protein n=1 Tax=Pseudomonas taiwanensis TaxID=470150 RepID=UPI0003F81247|nr:hypothetical protein [Pseudomonas taiwanensis]
MNGAPLPSQRDAVLAQLNASIDSFFLDGGAVQQVKGYEPVPRPAHRDIEAIQAAPAKKEDPRVIRRASQLAEIRKMARTMTCQEVQEATGYSRQALFRAGREGNFVFRRPESKNPEVDKREVQRQIQRNEKRIEELKLVERISALRDEGQHRAQVATQLELNYGTLVKIIERNNIDFPKVRARK